MTHPPKVCAQCSRVLDYIEHRDGSEGYVHAAQMLKNDEDHVPIPIDPTEDNVSAVCDFCYVTLGEDQWTVVTTPFVIHVDQHTVMSMSSLWAACPTCKDMLAGKQWKQLMGRALASMEEQSPTNSANEMMGRRFMLGEMYGKLRTHLVTIRRPVHNELANDRLFADPDE